MCTRRQLLIQQELNLLVVFPLQLFLPSLLAVELECHLCTAGVEIEGLVGGEPVIVVEHITRLRGDLRPDWAQPAQEGDLPFTGLDLGLIVGAAAMLAGGEKDSVAAVRDRLR